MTILVGTSSWTDPTLLKSGWYPPQATTAEQRLAFYAARFPLVEVDSTYYALPAERNSVLWVERTPEHFTFDIKAFALLTGHSAAVNRLPAMLRERLSPAVTAGGRSQLSMKDLPEDAQRWVWEAFAAALAPLAQAGKLGALLFQFPPWFALTRQNKARIEQCRRWLPAMRLAVEFRHHSWFDARNTGETLALLSANQLTCVAVDEPQGFRSSVPLVPAVTTPDLAMIRLHGRNAETWQARGIGPAERFKYLYSESELDELAPKVQQLAEQAEQTHVLFNNCYSDFGVRNAAQLAARLDERVEVQ